MEGLTEGRIVHYVMPSGEHRPAIVVRVRNLETVTDGYVNLVVFVDGVNDVNLATTILETSVFFNNTDKPVGTWHWIEKV